MHKHHMSLPSLFSECFRGLRAAKKEGVHSEGGTVESGGKEEIKSRRRTGRRRQEGEVERVRETSQCWKRVSAAPEDLETLPVT